MADGALMHLIPIVIMALVARGIAFAFSDGQVLGFAGTAVKKLPWNLHKPLGTCGNCAVSVWGTLALIVLHMVPDPLWILPLYWLAAAGLQDLIDP